MRFPRQEYWSGLPFLTPGDLPDPGIRPTSLASPALAGRFFTTEPPEKPMFITSSIFILAYFFLRSSICVCFHMFPAGSDGKESACSAGGLGSIPGSRRCPGEANVYPLQYSCLENSMDRAWWATVHGVIKSWTQLND